MRVFVSSSWRNGRQPAVVQALRTAGHEVYDFREPEEGAPGFSWAEVDKNWQSMGAQRFRELLNDARIVEGFSRDMAALRACDALVMVQPCGRSAALELGWACGAGKPGIVLLAHGEPELMLRMADYFCLTIEEVVDALVEHQFNS